MSVIVKDVLNAIDAFAPFSLAEEWDNAGLLAGSENERVSAILCALDLNEMVLDEAVAKGANLIVTHHPILFRGRKNLREDDAEGRLLCRLIRSGIALIAAHTNFDNAMPGVNDALAARLGLLEVRALENGMRVGEINAQKLVDFRRHVERTLDAPVRCYGEADRSVRRIALLGGAGEDFWPQAIAAGADAYLTGECAHHKAWEAYQSGICILEAGHAATELPAIELLAKGLQNAANGVQWNVRIYTSEVELFR